MFTKDEMLKIRDCLVNEVNENFKKFRRHTTEDMSSLQIIKKIDLLRNVKN
ncbi:hypothetical protein SAMN05421741_15010 [Paenimyroides ummariense]|uniref:Uncharacterized protein n=1 Tax=Paenimyroides ummariense TaxID=913024 RepID=A0A1I5GUF1_9FLAO|nr:hypothetical protein SAMN05421741_15010 [Paenimyroides ummariense]